jgi:hypothetical protein
MRATAIAILLAASPAFAQGPSPEALRDCPPIGQTAKGELIYKLDCAAIKSENGPMQYKPDVPATNMPATVIPKAGAKEVPPEAPPKGEPK